MTLSRLLIPDVETCFPNQRKGPAIFNYQKLKQFSYTYEIELAITLWLYIITRQNIRPKKHYAL